MSAVGFLTLLEALRGMPRSRLRFLWPLLIVGGAVLLPAFVLIVSDRPLRDTLAFLWRDIQQRQHLLMAVTLLVAGGVEFWRRWTHRAATWWVWPAALMTLAGLLMTHTQYGTVAAVRWAERQHAYHGMMTAAAAIGFAAGHMRNRAGRIGSVAGPLLLLGGAILLLLYREAPGAYDGFLSP